MNSLPPELLTVANAVVYFFLAAPSVITLGAIIFPEFRYVLAIWLLRSYRLRRATEEYAKAYSQGLQTGDGLLLIQPERHPLSPERLEEVVGLFSAAPAPAGALAGAKE